MKFLRGVSSTKTVNYIYTIDIQEPVIFKESIQILYGNTHV